MRPGSADRGSRGAGRRFLLTGVASSGVYGAVATALGAAAGISLQAAHLIATAISTAVASALHRGFTFHAARSATWQRSQVAGAGAALVGFAATSGALAVWQDLAPHAGRTSSVLLVYAVQGLVGVLNFLVMRRALRAQPQTPAGGVAGMRPDGLGG
ncbi:GtrA family protein [Puerhibacterium puerhi]|uniref:GtrA family protein n=1 Tax=Puerhibacterium puerhi TaxID=2692623 RepID=UPI0022A75C97|nr:GtrA family protein [Puerhibacterium puerhi]